MAKKKRPTDINEKAKSIVIIATGQAEDTLKHKDELKAAAAALGKKGGLKGGPARAKSLTSERRSQIAKRAAKARWSANN